MYEASTARKALDSLLDFHIAYTPKITGPSRIIEAQRAKDPELSSAFERRPSGRRQITRHVMNRLAAEGDLEGSWTVDEASDFVRALMAASFTSDVLEERRWSTAQLRARLSTVIQSSLLASSTEPTNSAKGGKP